MRAYVDASPVKACVLFENGTKEFATAKATYTSNEAEYRAILLALYVAKGRNINLTEIVSDSQLVIKQLTGKNKIKKPELGQLAARVWEEVGASWRVVDGTYELTDAGRVKFTWVRREENPAGKALG